MYARENTRSVRELGYKILEVVDCMHALTKQTIPWQQEPCSKVEEDGVACVVQ